METTDQEKDLERKTLLSILEDERIVREKLQESEEKFRFLADKANDLICIYCFKPEPGFDYVSPSATNITGYTPEDHYNDPQLGLKLVHPDDLPILQSMFANKIFNEPIVLRWRKKDGTIIWTEQQNVPVYDEKGELIAIHGIARDITSRKLAEDALKESEENYREIFNSTTEAIFIDDADTGKIIDVNDSMLKMYGYSSKEEVLAGNIGDLSANIEPYTEERAQELIRKTILEGPQQFEWIARRKDGSTFWIEMILKRTTIGGQNRILAVGRDITERKQLEETEKETLERQKKYSFYLSELIKSGNYFSLELNQNLKIISEIASAILNVNRVSIWRYEDEYQHIRCLELYEANKKRHTYGQMLTSADFPEYIKSHQSGKIIIADDVYEDLRTRDIQKNYFAENNITSLIDVPIWVGGELFGILSFEHTDKKRHWLPEEEQMAITLSSYVALYFEIFARTKTEEELKYEYEFNQTLIQSSPAFFVAIDAEGKTISMNQSMLKALNYSLNEVVHKDYLTTFVPEYDREVVSNVFTKLIKEKESTFNKNRVLTKDGKELIVEWYGKPIFKGSEFVYFISVGIDITERIKAEEEIQRHEIRYKTLIESVPVGIFQTDPTGSTTYVNNRWCEITKMNFDDALGFGWLKIVHPDDRQALGDNWRMCIEKHITSKAEYRIIQEDDVIRWISGVAIPQKNETGNLIGYIGTIIDITERKQAEEALRVSEQRYRTLIDGMNDTILVIDFDTSILDVNESACKVLGYTRDELLAMKIPDIDDNLEPDQIKNLAANMPKDKIQVFETWHKKKNGERIPVEISSSFITYKKKQAIMSIARDITERKEAEKELRESEEKYRSIFNNSQIAIILKIPDGKILSVNDYACWLFGRTRQEILSLGHDALIATTDPRFHKFLEERRRTGYASGELTFLRADGTKFEGEISSTIFKDKDGNERASMIIQDITERKLVEEKIKKLNEELEQKVKEKTLELQERVKELERFYDATIDRELRMKELRDEIARLKSKQT